MNTISPPKESFKQLRPANCRFPIRLWNSILWIAPATSILALIPVLLILVGEPGNGPASTRTWVYLALFPIGFSAGYLFVGCHCWLAQQCFS